MNVLTVLTPLVLFAAGAYFAARILPLLAAHPRRLAAGFRSAASAGGRALAVALAGTLGVGNIAGVASALVLGGAGAVFWMWAAAFFAMFLKYAEIVLALVTRREGADGQWHGGAMYYIRAAFQGRAGRVTAALFAGLCLLGTFSLGSVIQTNAAAEALDAAFRVPPMLTGAVLALSAGLVLWRGGGRVEAILARLVPFVCVLFSVAALAVLILRRAALPAAFGAIVRGAFSRRGAVGGMLGLVTSRTLRAGVARGLVSNEAGCGTAPIAHAASTVRDAPEQGLCGMAEVFLDTAVLCTMTALVVLVSGVPLTGGGTALALAAFSAVLGRAAVPVLAVSVVLFAFATVLCWAHYGMQALVYLTPNKKAAALLRAGVVLCAFAGAVGTPALLWSVTDAILALMAFLNLAALFGARRKVIGETAAYFRTSADARQAARPRRVPDRKLRLRQRSSQRHSKVR